MEIAEALGDVEIVSMDSMQIYRGMDIGTAKPDAAQRTRITHHLLDVADPDEAWSVVCFRDAARSAVSDIEARGHRALLVGGTGLYVQAVIDDLQFPGEDLELRARLEAETAEPGGLGRAYARLADLDPLATSRIDEHNRRRIVRALEVTLSTGRPFSSYGPGVSRFGPSVFPVRLAGIWLPRQFLARRIDERVRVMREAGLVDEVRELLAAPGGLGHTAAQAIGYADIAVALEAGDVPTDSVFDTIARRTRSFARRQRMWFRRDPRVTWWGTSDNPQALAPALLAAWKE
ncbi:MAG: tRNA (adenosine(37)-N6)-dimethylallyltransferase MiaA [Acidimicrobiia bacterium]|nr:tRNA (adenosine(37)-N6)-dimethylallyltransferase MiaA [Acidimicrobiia bacterium]